MLWNFDKPLQYTRESGLLCIYIIGLEQRNIQTE